MGSYGNPLNDFDFDEFDRLMGRSRKRPLPPRLSALPGEAEEVHERAYRDLSLAIAGVRSTEVYIDPNMKIPVLGGLLERDVEPSPVIVVNPEIGNLSENTRAFERFKSIVEKPVVPEDFLRSVLTHEYCHIFETEVFDRGGRLAKLSPYEGYDRSLLFVREAQIAVGEAFVHWLQDSITQLGEFKEKNCEGYRKTADVELMKKLLREFREKEKGKGRDYVLQNAQNILIKIIGKGAF